jgi:hypothetical protein
MDMGEFGNLGEMTEEQAQATQDMMNNPVLW